MFRNEPSKDAIKSLQVEVPENLKEATTFITQSISSKNKLLSLPYLTRPNSSVLKQIYIIDAINHNLRDENQIDNYRLIDSLKDKEIMEYELLDNYYGMLFTSVGNKNQPFDFSKVDFKMNEYNLKNDTEKGILFLRCMQYCGVTIWGFINIAKPQNTEKAYANIKKFPKFNGQPYYQYNDFFFPDFEMQILVDKDPESYKGYYLNKYYETLLNHLLCLKKEGGSSKEIDDLLLGSILKERRLYKFSKNESVLEELFSVRKMD